MHTVGFMQQYHHPAISSINLIVEPAQLVLNNLFVPLKLVVCAIMVSERLQGFAKMRS